MNITWKSATDIAIGDRVYVRPLGGPDEVVARYDDEGCASKTSFVRIQVVQHGFFARHAHELVAVESS